MSRQRASSFGEKLGQSIGQVGKDISLGIQQRYLMEAKNAQKKTDRKWEIVKYLMQQGLDPETAQYVTQQKEQMPMFQQAYAAPAPIGGEQQFIGGQSVQAIRSMPDYQPGLIQQFEEWKKGKQEDITLGREYKREQIEALKKPKGGKGAYSATPVSEKFKIWFEKTTGQESPNTIGEATLMLREMPPEYLDELIAISKGMGGFPPKEVREEIKKEAVKKIGIKKETKPKYSTPDEVKAANISIEEKLKILREQFGYE